MIEKRFVLIFDRNNKNKKEIEEKEEYSTWLKLRHIPSEQRILNLIDNERFIRTNIRDTLLSFPHHIGITLC